MRLRSMEEERHADVSDVAGNNDEEDRHPPSGGQIPETWHPELRRTGKLESHGVTAGHAAREKDARDPPSEKSPRVASSCASDACNLNL
jgi:hypothetical protein